MIIFGTRSADKTIGSGTFYCPRCQANFPYLHKRVRQYFSLYFIPLIPLGTLGEQIECQQCGSPYGLEVLNYDPGVGAAEFQEVLHRCVKQLMIDAMLTDGTIKEVEVQAIRRIYQQMTGKNLAAKAVKTEARQVASRRQDTARLLTQIARGLDDEGKELVVRAAVTVATADGELQDAERALLAEVGNALGMSPVHLDAAIEAARGGSSQSG